MYIKTKHKFTMSLAQHIKQTFPLFKVIDMSLTPLTMNDLLQIMFDVGARKDLVVVIDTKDPKSPNKEFIKEVVKTTDLANKEYGNFILKRSSKISGVMYWSDNYTELIVEEKAPFKITLNWLKDIVNSEDLTNKCAVCHDTFKSICDIPRDIQTYDGEQKIGKVSCVFCKKCHSNFCRDCNIKLSKMGVLPCPVCKKMGRESKIKSQFHLF